MPKSDIVNLLRENSGLPNNQVQEKAEGLFDTLKEAILSGESVK